MFENQRFSNIRIFNFCLKSKRIRKNLRFPITGDYHDSCDLIWKIAFTFLQFYSKFDPKSLNQKSGYCAKLDPKTCGMSRTRHILEDTPGDTEIQVFVFCHRQISKRRMFGNVVFFEIQVFVFDHRRISKRRMFGNRIFEIQVFVFDHRQILKIRMFENLGFFVIQVFVFHYR